LEEYKSLKNENSKDHGSVPLNPLDDEYYINCNQITVGWRSNLLCSSTSNDDGETKLENVSFLVQREQVLAIVGHVGSGKVSL